MKNKQLGEQMFIKYVSISFLLLVISATVCCAGGNQQNNTKPAVSEAGSPTDGAENSTEEAGDNIMYLKINNITLTATLVENSSTKALKELLAAGPITIQMHDYGNMEKVGSFGRNLPTNDERITTEPGDLILYQGNAFVIYYAPNTFSFTRLGKINNITQEELKMTLGNGNVTVTLSK